MSYGLLSVYRGHASGTLQPPLSFNFSANSNDSISVGDYNQDGRPDITAAHPGSPQYGRGSVGLMLNDGAWPAPLPISDGPRRSQPAIAMHFASTKKDDATGLPRSGLTSQPRVAQRTLGEPTTHPATLKGLDSTPVVQPFQGKCLKTTDDPGCAARSWAVESNLFEVDDPGCAARPWAVESNLFEEKEELS